MILRDPATNPRRTLSRWPQDRPDPGRPPLVGCVPPRDDEDQLQPQEEA